MYCAVSKARQLELLGLGFLTVIYIQRNKNMYVNTRNRSVSPRDEQELLFVSSFVYEGF